MYHKPIVLFLLLFTVITEGYSQTDLAINDTIIYDSVDQNPILISDSKFIELENLQEFINANLIYPDTGLDCQGKVLISIIIEKDGTVGFKKFDRHLCTPFDEKSMEVVDLMKRWIPGKMNGISVRTRIKIPITWQLE
jgi:hypothetical protein